MRQRAIKLLADIERVKVNPMASGIGKKSGLFDALDNIAGLVVELVDQVEYLTNEVTYGKR